MEKQIIGTDISLDVCISKGYLMLEFEENETFDRTKYYRVFGHEPDYLEELKGDIILDTMVSFDDCLETYGRHKKGMDECMETGNDLDFNTPDFYTLLSLASDINSYTGLE